VEQHKQQTQGNMSKLSTKKLIKKKKKGSVWTCWICELIAVWFPLFNGLLPWPDIFLLLGPFPSVMFSNTINGSTPSYAAFTYHSVSIHGLVSLFKYQKVYLAMQPVSRKFFKWFFILIFFWYFFNVWILKI